jgi:Na+-translocating ferredoxin:NAD+ oxidoreductase subunit B
MHTVVTAQCTGCELCLPVCPVDCITMVDATPGRSGWAAWSAPQAGQARDRYAFHQLRVARDAAEQSARLAAKAQASPCGTASAADLEAKRAVIDAALERARQRKAQP